MPFDIVIGRLKKDVEKYGLRGTIFLGKQYVQMGQVTSLSNSVHMDVARSHVVFVCGKRGGGKCVLGSVRVELDKGAISIEQIYNELAQNSVIVKKSGAEEYLKPSKLLNVVSVSDGLTIVNKPISFIYKKYVREHIVRIKTRSGREITVTQEHPLLVLEESEHNGEVLIGCTWKEATQLRVGDHIAGYAQCVEDEIIERIEHMAYNGWVYDLTVEDTHNFIGNNLVCHNSYTMGVIAEGIAGLPQEIRQNIAVIMLDTMGVYWTMKYPNNPDAELLHEWGLEAKGMDIKIFTPAGFYARYKDKGIPTDAPFTMKPGDLNHEDWCLTFGVDPDSPPGILMARVIHVLIQNDTNYEIEDMIKAADKDERSDTHTKNVIISHLQRVMDWGIFSGKEGTPLKALAVPGQITVLDMSPYATLPNGWRVKSLVIGLVGKKLFIERMISRKNEEFSSIDTAMHYFSKESSEKLEEPLVWLIIDEAHEMLPNDEKTSATDALVTIMREGRQPGISVILASQQPGKIHTDVMTQSDIVISHRLTAQIDMDALGKLMQSYMREGLAQKLDALPRTNGAALTFDDANERIFPIHVRPRFTWHGGSSPTAVVSKAELFPKVKI